MIENEDSVVTSLNELRKLKNERISRQSQSRSVSSGNRAVALAEDPLADQLTPPPSQGFAAVSAHAPAAFEQNAAFAPAANRFASAQSFDHAPVVQAPPVIVTKTSYKAAVLMTVLLGGAGAAGYMKLQQDTQSLLAAKEAAIKSAEDARMRSVEASAKAEQITKTNLRQCEDKLKANVAAAAAPAPAVPAAAAVAPVVDKKPEKPVVAAKASRSHHAAARPARQAAAPAAREPKEKDKDKGADVPTIAKKKKVNDDPLAGLGKL